MRNLEQASAGSLSSNTAVAATSSPDRALLERGLGIARGARGMTFIAVPAALAPAAALIDSNTVCAWSTADGVSIVGIGVARELRASGDDRWTRIARAAREIVVDGAAIGGASMPIAALERARPRWFGGGAFATGAADRAPWAGFGDAWFVLPRWTYVREGNVAQLVLAVDPRDAEDGARWHAELGALRSALASGFAPHAQPSLAELAADGSAYRDQVAAIVDAIARGESTKIVAARTCEVALGADVRVADLFASLDARHAECTRVVMRPTGAGTLVAATPERLVRKTGALVECDALAGTIAVDSAPESIRRELLESARASNGETRLASELLGASRSELLGTGEARIASELVGTSRSELLGTGEARIASELLLGSAKDQREHEIVVSAIRDALAETGADVVVAPTQIRALRHVLHLHAPIRATLRSPTDAHVLDLVARLHPTPAVGGAPTASAVEWIVAHEAPRGWYASPVGWFDLDGDGEFAVAIRSGVIAADRAHLWAGAGIVAGSDPDRELAETDNKLRAMLGALGVVA